MSQALASLEAVGRYLETAGNFAGLSEAKGNHISFLSCQFARHTWNVTEAAEVLNLCSAKEFGHKKKKML